MTRHEVLDICDPLLTQLRTLIQDMDPADAAKVAGEIAVQAEDLASAAVEERDRDYECWQDQPSLSPAERNPGMARGVA